MLDVEIRVPRREFEVSVSFSVAAGERFALYGPSGAGKTTVLEAIAGVVSLAEGSIVLAGRTLSSVPRVDAEESRQDRRFARKGPTRRARPRIVVPIPERRVALLRQDPALFPHLSVGENITYSTSLRPGHYVDNLIDRLGLSALLGARPSETSGGQAQRVALARALATTHLCLLLDEPFTGLDPPLRRELTGMVREEVARNCVPAVLVTHELEAAQAFADRIGVLDQGRLLQVGPPAEILRRPASYRVAELLGYRGLVPAEPPPPSAGTLTLLAAVHPQRVALGRLPGSGPVLEVVIEAARPAGSGWEIDAKAAGRPLSFWAPCCPVPPGQGLVVTLLDPPWFLPDGRAPTFCPEPARR